MAVDITAFYRPQLPGPDGKHDEAFAGEALPAVLMGLVGRTDGMNGQRLAVLREVLRVSADDAGEAGRKQALLRKVAWKLGRDEAAVLDAAFRLREVQAAGSVQRFPAATLPVRPTGFWDRHPKRTPGRLRRALLSRVFPGAPPLPERMRKKASATDHLPKGKRPGSAGRLRKPPDRCLWGSSLSCQSAPAVRLAAWLCPSATH